MLSFLRARSTRSSPPRLPLRDLQWDGHALTLALDPELSGEPLALDLDGFFFANAQIAADGRARFAFPIAPNGRRTATILLRRRRDGESLIDRPRRIRFGEAGLGETDASDAVSSASNALGDIGHIVPFGVDCTARDVAIVVPVYNAPAEVERCLDSVVAHTSGAAHLIVIDDASADPAIAPLLERYASRANVRVLRNERNLGFTATANRGIGEAGHADVVLLNADTEVGPNWLTGLRRAAASAVDIATVTAVSDNAGAFSVPELEQENALPAPWTFEQTALSLWQSAGRAYPALPTGNGFCMFVRHAVIDAVGAFDSAAFPQGYGEENDFCQRASARGLRHVIAGNVYVRHARSASFGHERRAALGNAGMAVLRARWPHYEADVAASLHSFERRVLDWRVRCVFATSAIETPRLRVLCAGDTTASPNYDLWRVSANGNDVERSADRNIEVSPEPHGGDALAKSEEQLWSSLQAHAIEVVISDEAMSPSLPRMASALDIPFARAASGETIESAVSRAIAAARSFAERTR